MDFILLDLFWQVVLLIAIGSMLWYIWYGYWAMLFLITAFVLLCAAAPLLVLLGDIQYMQSYNIAIWLPPCDSVTAASLC